MDLGKGFHRWNTIPTRCRRCTTSMSEAYTSLSRSRTLPECRAPGIVSFIRLIERRNVDFPQPDGPISAVIERGDIARSMSYSACFFPYQNEKARASTAGASELGAVTRIFR